MTLIAALLCSGANAEALKYQERPPWMVNVGIGIGQGDFADKDGTERTYHQGAVRRCVSDGCWGSISWSAPSYQAWIIEFDRTGDIVLEDAKLRRSLQDLTLGLAWFPGNHEGPWGGLYIRAAAGMGWGGTALIPVEEGGKQEHGERIDDWGTGVPGRTRVRYLDLRQRLRRGKRRGLQRISISTARSSTPPGSRR